MWKVRLKEAIDNQASEFQVEHVRSTHHCDFGKWLDAEKPKLVDYTHYPKVCQLHAQVHEETARIMTLALSGQKEAANEALAFGGEFANKSAHLTQAMMAWRDAL